MIIDINNIIGRHKYKPEIKAATLISSMDKAKVDKALIFCHAESMDNESIRKAVKEFPDRLIGMYTVNPWMDKSEQELKRALESGFSGLRLDAVRHGYVMNDLKLLAPLLNICREAKVPVWGYGAAEVFSTPILFQEIAREYPDIPIIMGYMGFTYDASSACSVAERCSNVYVDTTGCMPANVIRALKTCGPRQIVMGTGTPDFGYFELEIQKILEGTDNKEYQELILGGNAARIFNIN